MKSKVSVVIPARNESGTISKVIRQVKRIKTVSEIIIVCNGSTDRTSQIAKKAGATKIVSYKSSLGHDVGRSVGAKYATGDIILFVDADFIIPHRVLIQYVQKIEEGWDVALNAYSGRHMHPVTMSKYLLNHFLDRPDLIGCSMTTVPHALSRKALDTIGADVLAVPPKAQAIAILQELKVTTCGFVNTAKVNKRRKNREYNVLNLILGDHAEALSLLTSHRGPRGRMTDYGRLREMIH